MNGFTNKRRNYNSNLLDFRTKRRLSLISQVNEKYKWSSKTVIQ